MAKQGWIEKRELEKGVSFRVRYWAPDKTGKMIARSASFPSWTHGGKGKAEQAAKAHLARMLTQVSDGTYVIPSTITFRELIEHWIDARVGEISGSTIYTYRAALKHLRPECGNVPIQKLNAMHIQHLYTTLRSEQIGAGITRTLRVIINASLRQAVRWGVIVSNPADNVTKQEERPSRINYWTPEQSAFFIRLEESDETHGIIWRLGIMTGMRMGEMLALRWSDIDFTRETITISRTVTRDENGRGYIGDTTKTRNSRRTIRLPASCVAPLKQHRIRQRERQLAAPEWAMADGDLVLTQDDGRYMRAPNVGDRFRAAVKRSGLPAMTPHGMRHTFATAMLINGVHPKTVAALLGDTVEMVLKVYSHVTEGAKEDAIASFDKLMDRIREDADTTSNTTTSG